MDKKTIRAKLIEAGVKNLREFGYTSVTAENILSDMVFRKFFKSMLDDNEGKAGRLVDEVIAELRAEIEAQGE